MRKIITVVAVVILLAAIIVGVGQWMNSNQAGPGRGSGHPAAPTGPTPPASEIEAANPPGCSAYELIAAPGTWESKATDDPMNPTANPHSLLLKVTNPLKQEFDEQTLKVWTLPYTAQFRNINALHEMSYDASRKEGMDRINAELRATHEACPATRFILVGFSQGAVLTGDLAAELGNGRGAVPAEMIAGVTVIADGRQEDGKGNLVGNTQIKGIGAEIALNPVSGIIQPIVPGATMRGPRPDGFGELNDRVNNLCAPADLVCDAPRDLGNAVQRAQDLVSNNVVHAQYATNPNVVPGTTTTEWVLGWVRGVVQQ